MDGLGRIRVRLAYLRRSLVDYHTELTREASGSPVDRMLVNYIDELAHIVDELVGLFEHRTDDYIGAFADHAEGKD